MSFTVHHKDGKSYTIYSEENGKFYCQNVLWSEKYGIMIPQTKKRTSKKSYMIMKKKYENE